MTRSTNRTPPKPAVSIVDRNRFLKGCPEHTHGGTRCTNKPRCDLTGGNGRDAVVRRLDQLLNRDSRSQMAPGAIEDHARKILDDWYCKPHYKGRARFEKTVQYQLQHLREDLGDFGIPLPRYQSPAMPKFGVGGAPTASSPAETMPFQHASHWMTVYPAPTTMTQNVNINFPPTPRPSVQAQYPYVKAGIHAQTATPPITPTKPARPGAHTTPQGTAQSQAKLTSRYRTSAPIAADNELQSIDTWTDATTWPILTPTTTQASITISSHASNSSPVKKDEAKLSGSRNETSNFLQENVFQYSTRSTRSKKRSGPIMTAARPSDSEANASRAGSRATSAPSLGVEADEPLASEPLPSTPNGMSTTRSGRRYKAPSAEQFEIMISEMDRLNLSVGTMETANANLRKEKAALSNENEKKDMRIKTPEAKVERLGECSFVHGDDWIE